MVATDGRAIPTLGYQLEDMTDDYHAPAGAPASAGARALEASACQDQVGALIGTVPGFYRQWPISSNPGPGSRLEADGHSRGQTDRDRPNWR